jgi:uncharacterized protein YggE
MKRIPVIALALVAALAAALLLWGTGPGTAVAADPEEGTAGVLVDGQGEVSGTPDVLRLTLGARGVGRDVSAALSSVNAQITRIRQQLVRDGAKASDIQTSDVSIYPTSTKQGRRYEVNETLTAKLRDLKRAGALISNAVDAGGNGVTLHGVSFALEDNVALLDQARDKAFADARKKAERYARLAGGTLGDVQLVSESSWSPPMPYAQRDVGASKASDVPLYTGSSQVGVSVTVRWALS